MNINDCIESSKFRGTLFVLPLLVLMAIVLFLYSQNALTVSGYIQIQKAYFFSINHHLGQYPSLQYNITQLGDALVILSLLSIVLIYTPRLWEVLIPGLLVSLLFSCLLKENIDVPRPAEIFKNGNFIIVGRKLVGFCSTPSGHSITVFVVLTVLLFSFMPKRLIHKFAWSFFIITVGLLVAFSRIGVGAHFPIDILIGSVIGYISGLAGIFIYKKFNLFGWINCKKARLFFITLLLVGCIVLIIKIMHEGLFIFYVSLACLVFSLYKSVVAYAKNI